MILTVSTGFRDIPVEVPSFKALEHYIQSDGFLSWRKRLNINPWWIGRVDHPLFTMTLMFGPAWRCKWDTENAYWYWNTLSHHTLLINNYGVARHNCNPIALAQYDGDFPQTFSAWVRRVGRSARTNYSVPLTGARTGVCPRTGARVWDMEPLLGPLSGPLGRWAATLRVSVAWTDHEPSGGPPATEEK